MLYRFRIILDVDTDVFRDIEVESNINLEDFHKCISKSFGFNGEEMASFYKSDEDWNQGEEFSLFDTEGDTPVMADTILESVIDEDNRHLLYVYDFYNMWTFFVELKGVADYEPGTSYPNIILSHGFVPENAPEKQFLAEDFDEFDEYHGYNSEDYY